MYTSTSRPKTCPAKAREEPHCPAPVSVVSRVTPSCLLSKACATAVFGLCDPVGETPSYL